MKTSITTPHTTVSSKAAKQPGKYKFFESLVANTDMLGLADRAELPTMARTPTNHVERWGPRACSTTFYASGAMGTSLRATLTPTVGRAWRAFGRRPPGCASYGRSVTKFGRFYSRTFGTSYGPRPLFASTAKDCITSGARCWHTDLRSDGSLASLEELRPVSPRRGTSPT